MKRKKSTDPSVLVNSIYHLLSIVSDYKTLIIYMVWKDLMEHEWVKLLDMEIGPTHITFERGRMIEGPDVEDEEEVDYTITVVFNSLMNKIPDIELPSFEAGMFLLWQNRDKIHKIETLPYQFSMDSRIPLTLLPSDNIQCLLYPSTSDVEQQKNFDSVLDFLATEYGNLHRSFPTTASDDHSINLQIRRQIASRMKNRCHSMLCHTVFILSHLPITKYLVDHIVDCLFLF